MIKNISKLAIVSILFMSFSCSNDDSIAKLPNLETGTGSLASKNINLNSFNEIEIANYCNVEIVTGTTNKVEYSDYDNLIQYLKFEIIGNKLIVKTVPENAVITNSKAKAKIYVAGNLTGLFISGVGNMTISNSFDNISTYNISGSGNIVANANATATSINATITGSGNIDILKINTQSAVCKTSGTGNITIAVVNSLNANISGFGNISYSGNPTITKNITGIGSVIKL